MKRKSFFTTVFVAAIMTSCYWGKPKVLIIGDSISVGYTPHVKEYFSGDVRVRHNFGNAQHTGTGLYYIEEWIGDEDWDIIQFNWGLWDLYHRKEFSEERENQNAIKRKVTCTIEEYTTNLDSIVSILKRKTNAKLIFVTTTYVPDHALGRFRKDAITYNDVAKEVMKKHSIEVNDIYEQSISIHNKHGAGIANVHYTDEGYKKLSELVIDVLRKDLGMMAKDK